MYLRVCEEHPEFLGELKEISDISYCYVLAKLGLTLSDQEAQSIILGNVADENFGLLVWSLGKMQNWAALKYVESNLRQIQEVRIAAIFGRAGVQRAGFAAR